MVVTMASYGSDLDQRGECVCVCAHAREKASRAIVSITVANEAGETGDGETHDDLGMDEEKQERRHSQRQTPAIHTVRRL